MRADNDNGPGPAPAGRVAILPTLLRYELRRDGAMYALLRMRPVPGIGLHVDAPLACPHPEPRMFGYHGGSQPAPSPAHGSTKRRRPAFIRGVVTGAVA